MINRGEFFGVQNKTFFRKVANAVIVVKEALPPLKHLLFKKAFAESGRLIIQFETV